MKRSLLLSFALIILSATVSAQQFEIGKASDHENVITADTTLLVKAIARTLNDGTVIQRLHIESKNTHHYLVAEGVNKNMKKIAAFTLSYNINQRTYSAEKDLGYFTCVSAACTDCSIFKEDGKINGCKCAEKATVSNECNFTRIAQSAFYMNIIRARMMMNTRKRT